MDDEAECVCDFCGEPLVVPVDLAAGTSQRFVQDCAVCCRPNVIRLEILGDGEAHASAEGEAD